MNRIVATVRLDATNQYRQGFYLAAAIILGVIGAFATIVPAEVGSILPALLLTNMTISTYAFLGAIVLLEKGEGTLESVAVTPLRSTEYLGSKIVTLAGLALIESLVLTIIARSNGMVPSINWFWIIIGALVSATLYVLLGFLLVIRCESINEFLMPMMGIIMLLELPGGVCMGMPEFWGLWLIPTYSALWIFRAAFEPVGWPTLMVAILIATIWIAVCFGIGQRALHRYVAGKIGRSQ